MAHYRRFSYVDDAGLLKLGDVAQDSKRNIVEHLHTGLVVISKPVQEKNHVTRSVHNVLEIEIIG